MPRNILIITTSNAAMSPSDEPTGLWLEELAVPYQIFIDAGYEVAIASPQGGPVPIDPRSLKTEGHNPPEIDRFLTGRDSNHLLRSSKRVRDVDPLDYDAVFLPGGHGTMWDLPDDRDVIDTVNRLWADGRVVAAVCHGPAGLVGATKQDGTPLVQGLRVNAFTDSEEGSTGLIGKVPFKLESRLRELGAQFESGPDFKPHVVTDDRLVTGQNPQSSEAVARAVIELLDARTRHVDANVSPDRARTAGDVGAVHG